MKNRELTLRSVLVGLAGLIVITASSMYTALRMGALPWPTVFVTVISFSILNLFKNKPTLNEINVCHTLMSAGAMVAGGIAFTVPGFWMAGGTQGIGFTQIVAVAASGAILGVVFTTVFRTEFIEKRALPYPMGQAAYDTLNSLSKGGRQAVLLFAAMGFSVVFTAMRDGFGIIPAVVTIIPATAYCTALTLYASPMAIGIGAMIGPALSIVWMLGAILGHFILVPVGQKTGLFVSFADADSWRQSLGMGLMVGTGLGTAVRLLIKSAAGRKNEERRKAEFDHKAFLKLGAGVVVAAVIILLFTSLNLLQTVLLILGTALASYIAGLLTGQTGINPMEILGILCFLWVSLFSKTELSEVFLIAGIAAVSCGLCGDIGNDLKSGHLLKTDHKAQIIAEGMGGVIGAVISAGVILVIKKSFGIGTEAMPAPQAAAVSAIAAGTVITKAFVIGGVIGLVLAFLNIPAATLGLGVYLPVYISSTMCAGALLALILKKAVKKEGMQGGLIASGFLGGEGITGVVIAIIQLLGL